MAQKSKTRSDKKKAVPKKKAQDEKQFGRFIETARILGADQSDKDFESAFTKLAKSKSQEK